MYTLLYDLTRCLDAYGANPAPGRNQGQTPTPKPETEAGNPENTAKKQLCAKDVLCE